MENFLLSDMDSLLLKVRNKSSQIYILEAVNAYRAGSFRSAIVSTWISLTFDIITKIRELASRNEPEALAIISRLNIAIENQDTRVFLNIEADILKDAQRLELISQHEFYSLEKLRTDRHLCAHPAFNLNEELFQPSPELVRTHIIHSLLYVLTQRPIQGKKAIQDLLEDINNPNFPSNYDEINNYIKSKYLNRAKESFIKNAVKVLLKNIIKETDARVINEKFLFSLGCFMNNKRIITLEIIKHSVNDYINPLEANTLINLLKLFPTDPDIWSLLIEENKISVKTLIRNNSNDVMYDQFLHKNLSNSEIKNAIFEGLSTQPRIIQRNVFQAFILNDYTDSVVDVFCTSATYPETKEISNTLLFQYAHFFTVLQMKKILIHTHSNSNIRLYLNIESIIRKLFIKTDHLLGSLRVDWQTLIDTNPTKYSFLNHLLNPPEEISESE